jgi:two-component system, cell cycle sensor histidine kinase and response regulator CckA
MSEKPTYEELEQRVLEFEKADSKRKQVEHTLRESESLLSSIFRAAPTGIGVVSNRMLLAVNERVCDMIGYSREEMIGQSARMLYPSDAHFENVGTEKYRQILQYGTGTVETQWQCKDGRIIDILMSSAPINPMDFAAGVTFTALDITERKKAEGALRESEERFRKLFQKHSAVKLIIDPETGNIIDANEAAANFYGWSIDEIRQMRIQQINTLPHESVKTNMEQTLSSEFARYEFRHRRADGSIRDVEVFSNKIDMAGKSFLYSIVHDISERVQAEEALLQEYAFRNAIIDHVAEGLCVCHETKEYPFVKFTVWNERMTEITGYTLEEINRLGWYQTVYPDSELRIKATERMQRMRQRNDLHAEEWEITRADGSKRVLHISTSVVESGDGLVHVLALMQDITERKQADEALIENRRRLADVIDFLPDATLAIDNEKRVIIWNKEIEKMTGVPAADMIGKGDYAYTVPFYGEARPQLMDLIFNDNDKAMARYTNIVRDGDSFIAEAFCNALYSNKGAWVYLKTSPLHDQFGKIIGAIESIRDITEHKRAEDEKVKLEIQLQQVQKFEAIGTLAGGVAHDFNNLLMGIQGRVSLLSFDLEASHPHLEHIQAIEEYIRSATNLTKQLLGFARGGKYEVKPIDLNELVLESSAMFGRTKKEIRIHTKCQALPLVVQADRGQIEQVLLNMYINAWQAMPPDGGELYLETKISTLDEAYCKPHQAEPGRYVRVSITDTGSGMDEATRQRVFDPFFTTKGKKRGTGLGLASAYGIIKNHGGFITVYSEIGRGTTFNIYLPLSDKEAHREVSLDGGIIKGSATILLVDDEEMIIEVGQAMLERLGYRVVVCRGGLETVNVITDIGKEIDLVILDMIMPGMDGGATFDRIREIQPEIPVILSSGYAINGDADKIMRRGCNGFIQKPYNISELSQKIRKVLDESKGSSQA